MIRACKHGLTKDAPIDPREHADSYISALDSCGHNNPLEKLVHNLDDDSLSGIGCTPRL